ncbi:MAG: DUF342 domain-containing protein [Tissierellia bacterium]|nr:DUF342 domain-containing protein [Tissierellia bacterium]
MHKISPNIMLEVSKDGMEAYITLIEDENLDAVKNKENHMNNYKKVEIDEIIKEIKDIITVGLKEDKLRQALLDKDYNKKIRIAEGVLPIDGKDGYIKYFFDREKKLTPKILKDGTVDYRELDSINNVNKGEQLAELVHPKEGKHGFKVTGEIIPYKKGKKPILRYGKNVTLLEEGVFLVAEKSGLVGLNNGKVTISEVFEVSNVDKKVGNIYFNGTVIVRKNILNGYKVKAYGDVEVKGLVEGGCIQNTGDVLVKQGIQGYNRLAVRTKGSIITKFIENAKIESDKNITAEAIMHSNVISGENIVVIGKRGLIAGGICRAGKEIRAKTIGSNMATTTVLEIGGEPSDQNKINSLKESIDTVKDNLQKVIKSINLLDNLKRVHELDDEKLKMYVKLIKTRNSLTKKLNSLKQEEELINKNIKKSSKGKIKVAGTIYPGVKITIGNSTYFVKDEMKRCTFYRDEGDIRVGPY